MKISFFVILVTCLHVSASVFSQEKISLDVKNVKLSNVLHAIEKQSNYHFVYDSAFIPDTKTVTLKVTEAPVTDILVKLLSPMDLSFSIGNNYLIIINKKGDELQSTVTGTVVDSTGSVLPGVSVSIKNIYGKGTVTDKDGKYTINVPDQTTVLVFSMIGFQTVEKKVENNSVINVTMQVSKNTLDEVVVQAYGKSTKRKINSAISTLDMTHVAPIPVQSINDAVAGRIPGVIVTTDNGAPGTKSAISIRGGGMPLYVIDNIVRSANDFSNINPNDIESYSVLKDAAATALYGVSGGDGVILVTTKQGKAGKTNINYSYNQIFSQPTIFPQKVSSYEQLNALNQVYIAEGNQPPTPAADLEKYRTGVDPINFPNTDWRKIAMKDFAPEMRHDFSVASGNNLLAYYASLSYYDQGTILQTDQNYNKRTTYRLNTTSNFEKIHLKMNIGLDGFIENNSQPGASYYGIYSHIQNKQPKNLAYNEFGLPSSNTVDNPAVELDPQSGYSKTKSTVFNGILGLEYEAPFLQGLKLKFNGNYNSYNSVGKSWNALAPSYANNSRTPIFANPPSLSASQGEGNTLQLQGYVTYTKAFGDHTIDFTGVYEQAQTNNTALNGSRQQYQILFDQFVAGPTLNQAVGGSEDESGRAAYLGRLSYNYQSKYFLDANLRYDGSDLFPPGKRWGAFYSFSGGYIVSEESFMQSLKERHILDYVKLRGSYGLTGINTGIARYQYISGYGINSTAWVVDGQSVQGTSEPANLPSTSFSWYNVKSRDFGIDLASLKNRLTVSADYFFTRTTGFVASDPRFAQTLGIGLPPINFTNGATRKEGADFNISWSDHISDFSYKIGLNYTFFNTLDERDAADNEATLQNPYTRLSGTEGGKLTTGYTNEGFYDNNGDLLTGARLISSLNTVAGDLKYKDVNGDGQINSDDLRLIGSNTFPRINYGLTFDLGYKGFSLSAVLQGSGGRDRYIGDVIQGQSSQTKLTYAFQQDYWRPDHTDALFPRQVSDPGINGGNNYVSSDFWIIQSKYLRLKYLQLGYDFKQVLLKRSPFQQLRLFVSGTNLLTTSKSQKYFIDPESDTNNYGYPVQRTISFGLNAGF